MAISTEMGPAPFWAKVSAALSMIVCAGFLAWAGVVWSASQRLQNLLFEQGNVIASNTAILAAQSRKLLELQVDQNSHERRPWHNEAGNYLSRIEAELKALRQSLEQRGID